MFLVILTIGFVLIKFLDANDIDSDHGDACQTFANNLPSFLTTHMDDIPPQFPSRCQDCPLGVPLNESMTTVNGFSPFGDFTRWHTLLRKIQHHKINHLNIAVLGGSLTCGHFPLCTYCSDPYNFVGIEKNEYSDYNITCRSKCPGGEYSRQCCQACTFVTRQ